MSESAAKAQLDPEGEEGETGYVTPEDIKDAVGIIYKDFKMYTDNELAKLVLATTPGFDFDPPGILSPAHGGTGVANFDKTLTLTGGSLWLAMTANTAVTLPTTGTLSTLAGNETLTNKTLTSPTLTGPSVTAPGGASAVLDIVATATSSSAQLSLESKAGEYGILQFRTGNERRWNLSKSDEAESGSNAGSNLILSSFDDNGNFLATYVKFWRGSGVGPYIQLSTHMNATTINTTGNIGAGGLVAYLQSFDDKASGYTPTINDASNKMFRMTSGSANNFTIPPNSSVAFDIGTFFHIVQQGAGQVTVAPGSGVTLTGTPGYKTRARYSRIMVTKVATDGWLVSGDCAA